MCKRHTRKKERESVCVSVCVRGRERNAKLGKDIDYKKYLFKKTFAKKYLPRTNQNN